MMITLLFLAKTPVKIIGCLPHGRTKKKRVYMPPGKVTIPSVLLPLRLRLLVVTELIQPFLMIVYPIKPKMSRKIPKRVTLIFIFVALHKKL